MAPKKKDQTNPSQSQNAGEGGVRKSSRLMSLAPSGSETTVSDDRTGTTKVVNPKPTRKSTKGPTNSCLDLVDDFPEAPRSQIEEVLAEALRAEIAQTTSSLQLLWYDESTVEQRAEAVRPEIGQRTEESSRGETSNAGERAEKPVNEEEEIGEDLGNQMHFKTEFHVETEVNVNEESAKSNDGGIKSPSKVLGIWKRRRANHGSRLFNYI